MGSGHLGDDNGLRRGPPTEAELFVPVVSGDFSAGTSDVRVPERACPLFRWLVLLTRRSRS
jgi:hypothetical protein